MGGKLLLVALEACAKRGRDLDRLAFAAHHADRRQLRDESHLLRGRARRHLQGVSAGVDRADFNRHVELLVRLERAAEVEGQRPRRGAELVLVLDPLRRAVEKKSVEELRRGDHILREAHGVGDARRIAFAPLHAPPDHERRRAENALGAGHASASCLSFSVTILRNAGLSSLPTRVTGKPSMISTRSGHLNLASPCATRKSASAFTEGASHAGRGTMKMQPRSLEGPRKQSSPISPGAARSSDSGSSSRISSSGDPEAPWVWWRTNAGASAPLPSRSPSVKPKRLEHGTPMCFSSASARLMVANNRSEERSCLAMSR